MSATYPHTTFSGGFVSWSFEWSGNEGVLRGAAGNDHELWVIPAGGKPLSLGLLRSGAPQRLVLPMRLAPYFRDRSTLAVSVEPVGGSKTGQPTGPVIAAGELSSI